MITEKKRIIAIFFTMICLWGSMVYATNEVSEKIEVKYIKTSDGDTARFLLDDENVRVRFLGINTPEISGENKVEEPYGNEALTYTKNKLDSAKKIEIEFDDVADKEDRFGRKLAWIWVDDELLELELLERGLAKTYMLKKDYKYATELKKAENKAKNAKVGLWSEQNTISNEVIENNTQEKETVLNNTPEQYKEEGREKEHFSIESYGIVVIIIFILLLLLKNKSKMK